MTFQQILASLTTNPVQRFGYSKRGGTIARGMDGDLVVLEGDPAKRKGRVFPRRHTREELRKINAARGARFARVPQKDVTAFAKVRYTIRGGRIIYSKQ
jgi:predicted amidohydrolase YtcJ